MNSQLTRRDLIRGSVAFAALAFTQYPLSVFGLDESEEGETLLPFLDQQPAGKQLRWENLKTWITPNEEVFTVKHYNEPAMSAERFRLEITGLVKKPRALSLADIKARRRKSVVATLECSGNSSSAGFMGAIGNVQW